MITKTVIIDPLKQALAKILNMATNGVEKGIDFLSAELPEVINQLLMWKMWESLLFFMIGVLLCLLPIITHIVCVSKAKKIIDDQNDESLWGLYILILGALCIPCLIVAFDITNIVWLQIWLAPKIYLIEYMAELIK